MFWIGVSIGILIIPVAIALAGLGAMVWAWATWKARQIRCRKEWTQENPYWRESFDDGVRWAKGEYKIDAEGKLK